MRDELFSAARNQGAWLRDRSGEQRPLSVSRVDTLGQALFALDWSRKPDLRRIALEVLVQIAPQVHDVRALGAAALALCWLAAGRVDGYFHMQLSPWDVAAACLIIQEAGGQISHPAGDLWHYSAQSGGVLASNGRLHQTILNQVLPVTQFQF
jgi:myo-inositol-1(or 4)-monophosphatase